MIELGGKLFQLVVIGATTCAGCDLWINPTGCQNTINPEVCVEKNENGAIVTNYILKEVKK